MYPDSDPISLCLTPACYMISREAESTNFIVFSLTQPWFQEFVNYCTSDILGSGVHMAPRVTGRVSYKRQELLTLHPHLGSSLVLCGVRVAYLISFPCCIFFSLSCVLCTQCCPCLWIVHSNSGRSGPKSIRPHLKLNTFGLKYTNVYHFKRFLIDFNLKNSNIRILCV